MASTIDYLTGKRKVYNPFTEGQSRQRPQQGPLATGQYRDESGKIVGGYSKGGSGGKGGSKEPTQKTSISETPQEQYQTPAKKITPAQSQYTGGRGIISPAKTSYSQYIKQKGYISGTVSYGIYKAFGKLAREEEKRGGQMFFGNERVQQAARSSVYAVPYAGTSIALGEGVEQVTTKRGRKEVKETFKENKFKGTLFAGATALSIIGGGAGVSKSISKALKLPKTEVEFVSRTEKVIEKNDGLIIESVSLARVKQKNLFNDKEGFVALNTVTKVKKIDDTLEKYNSITRAVYKDKLSDYPKLFGESKPFISRGKGFIKTQEVQLSKNIGNGITVLNEPKRISTTTFLLQTQKATRVKANYLDYLTAIGYRAKLKQKMYTSIGGGLSIPINEKVSFQYLKGGNIIEKGYFNNYRLDKQYRSVTKGYSFTKSDKNEIGRTVLLRKGINQQNQLIDKAVAQSIVSNNKKSILQRLPLGTNQQFNQINIENNKANINFNSIVYNQIQKDKTVNRVNSINMIKSDDNIKQRMKLRYSTSNRQLKKQLNEVILSQRSTARTIQGQKVILRQQQPLKQKQIFPNLIRTTTRPIRNIPIPITPFKFKKYGYDRNINTRAYKVYIKRFGKFRAVGGFLPRGKAIKFGESIAEKTLARTFKIKKTPSFTFEKDIPVPTSKAFRTYQLRNKKRISLPNVFIQKAPFSLASRSERRELQRARSLIR